MRIGLDARMYNWSGIGTYLKALIHGIAGLGSRDDFVCFLLPEDLAHFSPPTPNFIPQPCPVPVYSLREMTALPGLLRSHQLDLIHFPHYVYPFWANLPAVITIHDLIHLLFPHHHRTPFHRWYARVVMRQGARRAHRIITVSEYSKGDIVRHLGVSSDKVNVIYNGLLGTFSPDSDGGAEGRVRRRFGLDPPYFLYVGNAKEHKNLRGLFEAYRRLRARLGPKGLRPSLVLTVQREDLRGEEAVDPPEDVKFLGRVASSDLVDLYRGATLLALPSLCEGFGYPPLEAMACGTPVVASDAASLPEVAGDAALLVPAGNLDRLSDALYDVLTKEELRAELRRRGVERAERFSTLTMADATLRVYEEALASL